MMEFEYKGTYSILVQIGSLSSSLSLNWSGFLIIYLPLSGMDSWSHLRVILDIGKIIYHLSFTLINWLHVTKRRR